MYSEIARLYKESLEGKDQSIGKLIVNLKPLIINSIKKYYNNYNLFDDLIQEGNEIILRVLKTMTFESEKHFLGYVKNALRFHYLDKHKQKNMDISLNQTISQDEKIEMIDTIIDESLTQEEMVIKNEEVNILWKGILSLTERQQEIITLYYIERKPIEYIARTLNISYRTVVNTKSTALKRLKKIITKK
ncbi:RNA polymerase sigma factor, sigma-70 family [Gottschalkia purinilytica]|uniref:RNA polymerase sigma factor, sigma-70 family n=1 Tax=Gottschalkia purinilytica TaxID=1503 RepID=A0A0L0WE13_GOTPU|nr:sigma-70 family RNA polymerase sigma factor [Gottschalkia purinilytica]KNF09676.1 RNA polymerase sigma factor, sigma-70 family [Gottschalkia purinilytica]